MALLARPLGYFLKIDRPLLLWMAVSAALIDGLTFVVQAANQARLESRFFVTVSFAQFVAKVVLCVLFVVGFGWGAWGVVLAWLLRSVLFAGALAWSEWRHGLLWPNWQTLREMTHFVLPFLPTGLCFFVLNSGDRFFLVRLEGQDEVGIYGLGYRLAMLVGLFSLTPLNRVWSARLYDAAEEANASQVFGQMATRILGAYLLLGLALCLFQEEVIRIFAGNAFARTAGIVAPVVLAYWFQAASVLMESVFYVRRRTGCKSWIALASTLVMLCCYAVLIPSYGAWGAALATLAGFVFHAGLTWAVAHRVFPVKYEFGRLTVLLTLACCLGLISRHVGPGPWAIPAKLGLWLLWPIAVWMFGVLSPAEKQWMLAAIGARSPNKDRIWPSSERSPGTMQRPLVSIIIPTYNGARWLPESIDSALRQTYTPTEIIVVDDGSIDETPAILEQYRPRINVIRQARGDIGAARNCGITQARGDYLAFLDHDDVWREDKLATQVDYLWRRPEVDVMHADAVEFDDRGTVHESYLALFPGARRSTDIFRQLVKFQVPLMSTVLLKAAFLKAHGLAFPEGTSGVDDVGLLLKIAAQGGVFACQEERLTYRRLHARNLSKVHFNRFAKRVALYGQLLESLADARPEYRRALHGACTMPISEPANVSGARATAYRPSDIFGRPAAWMSSAPKPSFTRLRVTCRTERRNGCARG